MITFLIVLFTSSMSLAQSDTLNTVARNTVFAELGGMGFLYSVNYDHLLTVNNHFRTSLRGGLTGWWWRGGAMGIPVAFSGQWGKGKHFAEFGIGAMYSYGIEGETVREGRGSGRDEYINYGGVHLFGQLGYRLQKPEGGFFFRATFTPWMLAYTNLEHEEVEYPSRISRWVGISLGHTFKRSYNKK